MNELQALKEEAGTIAERIKAAAKSPAQLDVLQRQYGERLTHLVERSKALEGPPPK